MSVNAYNNHENELKKIYKNIKNCPKKSFDKIMKIHEFSGIAKKNVEENLKFIEKFILKNRPLPS